MNKQLSKNLNQQSNSTSFKVIVSIDPAGDCSGEYSGIQHDSLISAIKELHEARKDPRIHSAWIS